jgi:serine/threonine protein kinase
MTASQVLGDRYEIGGMLGRGGMTEVHRGRDLRLGREVAVKVLRQDLARDRSFQVRFRREAQVAASLNHPAIVAVYDTGEDRTATGATPYIVMEYVEGETLRDALRREGRLDPRRAMSLAADICGALDFSHRNGIVHQDMKPGNVMITPQDAVKVMNFGIARVASDFTAIIGTAQYLSPEQARGEGVDARSDIYSVGCLLYELITGAPPFTGDSPVAIAYQHVREEPRRPSSINPAVTFKLDAVLLKAMSKKPENRYQSAAEMRNDLLRVLPGQGVPVRWGLTIGPSQSGLRTTPWPAQVSRPIPKPKPKPAPKQVEVMRPIVVRVSETGSREVEHLADEVRSFNNANSSSTAIETIRVTHTARISTSVDLTKSKALSGGGSVNFASLAKAQAAIKDELVRHYSLQMNSELTFEQSTVVNIPAHTNVEVTFHWKLLWARGFVALADLGHPNVELAELPFKITVGLAFDKETHDV